MADVVWTPTLAYWVLTESLIIATIACRPPSSKFRRLSFLPIFALVCYQIFLTPINLGNAPWPENGMGCRLLVSLLFASSHLLLKDAQREVWLVGHRPGSIEEKTVWERLWWAAHLYYNPRAVGWSHEARGRLPPRPTEKTKTSFIASQLWYIARCFPLYSLVIRVARMNPYFDRHVDPADVLGYARLWRLGSALYLVMMYLVLSMEYTVLSIIWVGTGLSKPQDWPRLFGSPREMYTVRRFWGVAWHHMFRGVFSVHAEFLAKALGLPPKCKITTYFKLFAIFAISGLMHVVGDYAILHSWTRCTSMYTFLLQAVVIVFEDGILALARKAGLRESPLWRFLGYFYVVVWFGFSLRFWIDPAIPVGFMEDWFAFVVDHAALHAAIGKGLKLAVLY